MVCVSTLSKSISLKVGMLLRRIWTFRRRYCTFPLLLFGVAVCLFYQTLMVDRSRFKSGQPNGLNKTIITDQELLLKFPERLISLLETTLADNDVQRSKQSHAGRVVVLTGQHVATDTEVQLYQRVLQLQGYHVDLARYAETSSALRQDKKNGGGWTLLICLKGSEKSCLRKIRFSHLKPNQRVNIIPRLVEAFQVTDGVCHFLKDERLSGLTLPIIPSACGPSGAPRGDWRLDVPSDSSVKQVPVSMVNVYVLVSSATPLTAFFHQTGLVKSHLDNTSHAVKLQVFFQEKLGPVSSVRTSEQMKQVITEVLMAALLTTEESSSEPWCRLCFQLLTFTLHFSASLPSVVTKVQMGLHFEGLRDPVFDGQITKEFMLEDVLNFLLPPSQSAVEQESPSQDRAQREAAVRYHSCESTKSLCMPPDEMQLMLQFHQQLKKPENFGLPSMTPKKKDRCVDPHLRQLYTDPALVLTPLFNPWVKEYRAEVPFDVVTIRIRPEPVSPHCHIHLDEQRGPRMANYPVGLGNSRINILVMDESEPEPVVMTIYTLHIFRESRPSLPMFDDYVMCGFVQDCGLVVQPDQPCGLEPLAWLNSPGDPKASARPCTSGDVPGRWVVPCLSCSDNRTCDWREVTWHPDSCYYPLLHRPQLQKCMMDKKVLFIGDSTNRGMMYYLMERVNTTLEDWDKAHDTIIYHNLNQGRTLISYTYYPQFWLHRTQRPTFERALLELIERSRPLENSHQTVLVVGGVQWLNLNHLMAMQQVLERENLQNILVVVKSMGMGFHLPVDGIRSLSLSGVQELYKMNKNILTSAKNSGYEVVDTFSITMGRYKEFLQGRCACHFHEVGKPSFSSAPLHRKMKILRHGGESGTETNRPFDQQEEVLWSQPNSSYHVRGAVNQVYSEILLSRVCANHGHNKTAVLTD
ncbi:cadherin-like and PC-esterase domain-containing protein 1 [Chanos chanos]|uniref:Cadherin-like and PC-esterase domain-containing protein 1 n=1 Tax=Chanos chanos TaxID=29144 RepID=A0A6J2VMK2_CHACN|nr:cadherin-like and PC-esterase domain-containing protein 1 [Chanos chanos]